MTDLILAHDFSDRKIADGWFDAFAGEPVIHKVGLELFLAAGPAWVEERAKRGHRIFLDLKLHDIPNTVAQAVGAACDLGVHFLTVHLGGGREMLDGAVEKVAARGSGLRLLGVSVLTSLSEEGWGDLSEIFAGHRAPLSESIARLARLARAAGVPGVVSSALDLESVRAAYPEAYTVTPGIRLASPSAQSGGNSGGTSGGTFATGSVVTHQDQKRVVTPAQARRLGANAIVMGRPIFQSNEPLATARAVLKELR